MVKRLENWPILLSEYLHAARDQPFAWGQHDCALFVGKAVEALTGRNLWATYAGYSDEASAAEVIARGGGLHKIFTAELGAPHTNRLMAQRGDAVLMRLPLVTAGIVDDTGRRIASVGPNGMVRLPLDRASVIWRVG